MYSKKNASANLNKLQKYSLVSSQLHYLESLVSYYLRDEIETVQQAFDTFIEKNEDYIFSELLSNSNFLNILESTINNYYDEIDLSLIFDNLTESRIDAILYGISSSKKSFNEIMAKCIDSNKANDWHLEKMLGIMFSRDYTSVIVSKAIPKISTFSAAQEIIKNLGVPSEDVAVCENYLILRNDVDKDTFLEKLKRQNTQTFYVLLHMGATQIKYLIDAIKSKNVSLSEQWTKMISSNKNLTFEMREELFDLTEDDRFLPNSIKDTFLF